MSGEFWWWTRREISKNHRLSCFPNASTRTDCPFALKFCTEFHKTLLYKRMFFFFIIVSTSLFLKEYVWSKITHFYEKYTKLIVSKPMKYNQNADILLYLRLFTTRQREKILKRHYLWVQAHKKGEKQRVLGILYRNIYRTLKVNFQ